MVSVEEYLAKLDAEFKMLKDFVTATNTSDQPQFFGTPRQLTPVFARLGLLPTREEAGVAPVPGWIDDLAEALASDDPILLRINRKGEVVPARWYEYLEDGSIGMAIGDYLYAPLMGLNALVTAGGRGRIRAENDIEKIKKSYPVSTISPEDFAKQMREAERKADDELAKELKKWEPLRLHYKKDGEEGFVEVIPAALSNYPWFNLGGVAGGKEVYIRPEERRLGGVPAETYNKLFAEYNALVKNFYNYTTEAERQIRDEKIDKTKYQTLLNIIKQKGEINE